MMAGHVMVLAFFARDRTKALAWSCQNCRGGALCFRFSGTFVFGFQVLFVRVFLSAFHATFDF